MSMSSAVKIAAVESVLRVVKHVKYGAGSLENDVSAAEVHEINRKAELVIAAKKGDLSLLDPGYQLLSLTDDLHVPAVYVSEINETQELAVIRDGAGRLNVVLRGTKNIADLVDDAKIPFGQLHTRGQGRGARALAVVIAAVREYGNASVSVIGHSLGAAIALVVTSELAKQQPPVILDTHLFNLPLITAWDICKFVLCATSSPCWVMNKVGRRLGLNSKARRFFSGTGAAAAGAPVPKLYLNEYDLINKRALRRLRCRSRGGGNRVAFPAIVYINRVSPFSIGSHKMKQWTAPSLNLELLRCC